MADESPDDLLREMALHRGLKLVKSRRRKPGTGDYGMFGLTDATGKTLLGITDEGLTASAQEIEDYLRKGAMSTWQQSAKITPDRSVETNAPEGEAGPIADEQAASAPKRASSARTKAREEPEVRLRRRPASDGQSSSEAPSPKPEPPAPVLQVRVAKKSDAKALNAWLNASGKRDGVDANFQLVAKQGGVAIAVLDEIVGCCAWAMIPTLQHGLVGRVTLILVEEGRRRQGIGRQLLSVAEIALKKNGCNLIEVMSDIDLRNSHGFLRTLGFEQKSYRFARAISHDPREI